MRGQVTLTKARKAGWDIPAVFVIDLPFDAPTRTFLDPEKSLMWGPFAEVNTGPSDMPAILDFRFAEGCRVLVCGLDESRVRALMRRIRDFSPSEIIGSGFGSILRWAPKES